ncbi:MAG: hypothetical protein KGZ49_05005 [Syntrophaceae bacterium]|nr:hypothetical protein [Syntrophaceae bacterium]
MEYVEPGDANLISNLKGGSGNQVIRRQVIRTSGYQGESKKKEQLSLISLYPDTHSLIS